MTYSEIEIPRSSTRLAPTERDSPRQAVLEVCDNRLRSSQRGASVFFCRIRRAGPDKSPRQERGPAHPLVGVGATLAILLFGILMGSCARAPESISYPIRGQVISLYSENNEITLKHEEIEGFMPAMTMPIKVRDVRILVGLVPGDLVEGTLVVTKKESYLSTLEKVGFVELESAMTHMPSGVRLVRKGETVPDISLIDQNGRERNLSDFRGRPMALTFMYTRCPLPNFCPLMDRNFVRVQAAIHEGTRLSRDVQLISLTFDPDYDTPQVLRKHGEALGADPSIWSFVTGERREIIHFGEQFGITVVPGKDGSVEITHSLRTVVIDREGNLVKVFRGNEWTPDGLIEELARVSNPGTPGNEGPTGAKAMEDVQRMGNGEGQEEASADGLELPPPALKLWTVYAKHAKKREKGGVATDTRTATDLLFSSFFLVASTLR